MLSYSGRCGRLAACHSFISGEVRCVPFVASEAASPQCQQTSPRRWVLPQLRQGREPTVEVHAFPSAGRQPCMRPREPLAKASPVGRRVALYRLA